MSIFVPRRLPTGLREATLRELQRMENLGVIEKVEEYREWCAGMVVAPKTDGDCVCVSVTKLCGFDKTKQKVLKEKTFPFRE